MKSPTPPEEEREEGGIEGKEKDREQKYREGYWGLTNTHAYIISS